MNEVFNFLNNNLGTVSVFSAIATIGTIVVVVWQYNRQKKDSKKDTAKTIYQEIIYAEKQIKKIKDFKLQNNGSFLGLDTSQYLIKGGNWDKYKYLFVNDFSTNEWEQITDFYNKCNACDKSISEIDNQLNLPIQNKYSNIEEKLAEIAIFYANEVKTLDSQRSSTTMTQDDYNEKLSKIRNTYFDIRNNFINLYIDDPSYRYLYLPEKDYSNLNKFLFEIDDSLSSSSVGLKIKSLSK